MSELKAIDSATAVIENVHLVYRKSEADKVIAELEDKLQAADKQIENLINSASSIMLSQNMANDNICAELRHHKYKRCLAMAEWCDAEADVADADGDYEDMRWYQKWHNRWLAIAEKFKEAK